VRVLQVTTGGDGLRTAHIPVAAAGVFPGQHNPTCRCLSHHPGVLLLGRAPPPPPSTTPTR
jgi:hypothetical protein